MTLGPGGMLHYMLPEFTTPERAKSKPFMFAKRQMVVKAAGGSQVLDAAEQFMIGKRNYAALGKILFRNNVFISAQDVGGSVSRKMRLSIATGEVSVKISGQNYNIL